MTAIEAGRRASPRRGPYNHVLLTLVAIAALAGGTAGFVDVAPNRLVSGTPLPLAGAASPPLTAALCATGIVLAALAFAPRRRTWCFTAAAVAAAALVLTLAVAGNAAARAAADAPATASIALGAGFWIIAAGAALAVVDALQRAAAGPAVQLAAAVALAAGFFALASAGTFDALSLAHEYAVRRQEFAAAVVRHVELVAAAIVPALAIAVPLALVALRRVRFETPLFSVLNLLQTVPSIALFGLLIGPLSALARGFPGLGELGVGGVGPAPAIIALTLYALLPIARSTVAGIGGVPPDVAEAARGIGMTRRQVLWRVELPLAAPVLLAGLRIVIVQSIGLAVVAALIGAGGLGSFVFEGLGQYATDLVLLGALPAIVLALAADFLLRLLAHAARLEVRR